MFSDAINSHTNMTAEHWPALPFAAWRDTLQTLHMWTQIVGKVRLELSPFLNEWWEVTLQLNARGLTTGTIPSPSGVFEISFDFVDHNLRILTSDGGVKALPLMPRAVADFYAEFMAALGALGIVVEITPVPDEVEQRIPFDQDREHASYDRERVERWWRILAQASKVFEAYRSPFAGKSSPVQLFWGGFDLSQTRFSGRLAPMPKGTPQLMRLGEDQENFAVGFWPGNEKTGDAAFYSYAYPKPDGIETATIRPEAARWDPELGEFLFLLEDVRKTASPETAVLEFLQSTYEAAATLGGWDRERLERSVPTVGRRWTNRAR